MSPTLAIASRVRLQKTDRLSGMDHLDLDWVWDYLLTREADLARGYVVPFSGLSAVPVHVTALKKCHVSLISLDGSGALRRCGRDEPTNGSSESLGRRES